ncbi:hypothetical protein [Thermospira aquatica]|uniref:Uncharacterized protein n=1 Tax=Thermospira aquatica TaxID=2828656 RepID=A0AAX3BEB2_9SPIR|nr:hypothetical protein [Thermospira aquatica]URA10637.1 hypothetical protein KDW03_02190 [Thermospira aquatica]
MRKYGLFLFVFVSIGFGVDKAFVVKFHKNLVEALPPAFEAELQGGPIEKKLGTIPKDMVKPGEKTRVIIRYQRGKGMQLEVRGLTEDGTELYGDIFQPYVVLYSWAASFECAE